jgi:hypothetical protein
VLLLACACGAKAPVAVENVERSRPRAGRVPDDYLGKANATRPDVDISWAVPDFHDELRWPLTGMNHPTLEPRFPIAQELAIGIDWEQLCARGVHTRISATQKELVSYLRAWCEVQKRDADAACAHLTPLLGSVKSGLRPAVRQDLANIIVEHGDADKAEHWLSKHRIRDVATLDLLAANYVEVGSLGDAFVINRRVIDEDVRATDETKCMRLVKRIVIGHDHNPQLAVEALKDLAVKPKVPDPICERAWNKIVCWRDLEQCAEHFTDENIPDEARQLVAAYFAWPSGRASWQEWWNYADTTRLALPQPGAAALVVTAMEAALRASGHCGEGMGSSFRHNVGLVRQAGVTAELEERLQAIEKACPKTGLPPPPASQAPGTTSPIVPPASHAPGTTTPTRPASQTPAPPTRTPRPVAKWPEAPTAP